MHVPEPVAPVVIHEQQLAHDPVPRSSFLVPHTAKAYRYAGQEKQGEAVASFRASGPAARGYH